MVDFNNFDILEIWDNIQELLYDEKVRTYVILSIVAAIILAVAVIGVMPKVAEIANLSSEVTRYKDRIGVVTDRVKRLEQLSVELKGLNEELGKYEKKLPEQKEVPEFLEGLSSIAKASGLSINSITPIVSRGGKEKGQKSEYFWAMPVRITAKSGYHQLGNFINTLENWMRFVTIDELRILSDGSSPRKHNVRIVLKTYVAIDEKTAEAEKKKKKI